MNSLTRTWHFPEISNEPVPFYKHPYKLFALAPLTLLFWRTMDVAWRMNGVDPMTFTWFHLMACGLNICFISKILNLAEERELLPIRLLNAVPRATFIHAINLSDMLLLDELNILSKEEVLFVRVSLVAYSVFMLLMLVSYANKDKYYERQ